MKTNLIFSALLTVLFFNLSISAAQDQGAVICTSSTTWIQNNNFNEAYIAPANPIDVAPYFKKENITVDTKNSLIALNYNLSGFTNKATLQIQDFTGRTLKSFNVNTLDSTKNQFLINDLLSGVYKYVLIVDNQKQLTGEFTLNEY